MSFHGVATHRKKVSYTQLLGSRLLSAPRQISASAASLFSTLPFSRKRNGPRVRSTPSRIFRTLAHPLEANFHGGWERPCSPNNTQPGHTGQRRAPWL